MATDYALMVRNLTAFYDFTAKTVVTIGAGGGQFIGYARDAARVIAIDRDAAALDQLRAVVASAGLEDKFEYLQADFLAMNDALQADVALFEFCLHEMADPDLALARAGGFTREAVIFDHGRASDWAYCVAEEEKVARAWQAVERFRVESHRSYSGEQAFPTYADLRSKVEGEGEVVLRRIKKYRDCSGIVIPLTYELALVRFS